MKRAIAMSVILAGMAIVGCKSQSKEPMVYDVGINGLDAATRAKISPDATILRVEEREVRVQASSGMPRQLVTRVTYQTPDAQIHMIDFPKTRELPKQ